MSNSQQWMTGRQWPGLPSKSKSLALANCGLADASCMEQLLVHCANAIEQNDATLSQQIFWVLNNIAPPDGDSNQRMTCAFLRALIVRAARSGASSKLIAAIATAAQANILSSTTHLFTAIELAGFVDVTPWYRFGFTAANSAVLDAIEGFSTVHIVDLSLTHCMQLPTLLDAISNRFEFRPLVKISVVGPPEGLPPLLDLSYDELGSKLVSFGRTRNLVVEFKVIPSSYNDGFSSLIDHLRVQHLAYGGGRQFGEALVVNCQMFLHYIPEETVETTMNSPNTDSYLHPFNTLFSSSTSSFRSMFLKSLRSLEPTIVVLVDEDADLTSSNLVCRLRSAFNFLWIPYDTIDTFLPKGSKERDWYEADIYWKIENVIAHEGLQRVERLEPRSRWVQRMRNANFRGVPFREDAVSEVRNMLDEHAAGWGLKKEEDDLVLTWKGHNVVFATAWRPS